MIKYSDQGMVWTGGAPEAAPADIDKSAGRNGTIAYQILNSHRKESGDGIFLAVVGHGGFGDLAGLDFGSQVVLNVICVPVLESEFEPGSRDGGGCGDRQQKTERRERRAEKEFFHADASFLREK